MKKITLDTRKEIINTALEKKIFPGFICAQLLPISHDKLKKLGIKFKSKNFPLMTLLTEFKDGDQMRNFCVVIVIDEEADKVYGCLWEEHEVYSKICGFNIERPIWRGYTALHIKEKHE